MVFKIKAFLCFAITAKNLKIQNGCHTSFLCFAIFVKNLKIQKRPPFLVGQKFFGNWVNYSAELPCGSKILLKSLYLERDTSIFEKNSKIQNGRHFWQVKYSLKLAKTSLHRFPVDQTFCRKCSLSHGFRDKSIFVFCNYCEKFENSKLLPFLAGQNFFENWVFEKNSKIQNGRHFWQVKYSLKLGKASLHRYPVGQQFCQNSTSKFLFYEENGFTKYPYIIYCSICVPYEPIFSILCSAFFVKNLKIKYDPHFGGGKNFIKMNRVVCLDTLWVENFDKIALSHTVKEIQAVLCFTC